MKIRWILVVLMLLLVYPQIAVAKSQYGNINLYYNDQLLPRGEVAKPTLKIGEPFTVAVEMTMYQECQVSVLLAELGQNNFIVISGQSELDKYTSEIFKTNETHTFEWTLKPTDEWAGGTMPLNFHYAIYVLGEYEPVVNSGFAIAAPYITTEYYEGDTTPPTTTTTESPTSTEDPATPAFSLLAAAFAITIAATRRS